VGIFFSLACALTWGFAVVLLRRAVVHVRPFELNLFRVTVTFPLLAVTALLIGNPALPAGSAVDYLRLVASAVLGIVIADTLFHFCLRQVGAGITAIVDTLYSPMTVLFAFLLLGERMALRDYAGMALISAGVLVTGTLHPPAGRTRAQLIEGILSGLSGIIVLALAIVIAKPALEHFPVIWAAAFRQGVSAGVLLAVALISRNRVRHLWVLRPSRVWRSMLPGALLGSYVSLTLWIAGMKYTLAGIAAILTQSSTAYILLFSVLFLKEPFTRRTALAAALSLAGVAMVSLR
jgi:drug/metabolite transporter (DMT)-like permease